MSIIHIVQVRPDGSRNMLTGPAMSQEELAAAMAAGAEAVRAAVRGVMPPAVVEAGQAAAAAAAAPAGEAAELPADWRQSIVCLGEVGIGACVGTAVAHNKELRHMSLPYSARLHGHRGKTDMLRP